MSEKRSLWNEPAPYIAAMCLAIVFAVQSCDSSMLAEHDLIDLQWEYESLESSYAELESSYNDLLDKFLSDESPVYRNGYSVGYDEGYAEGLDIGYDEGYDHGYDEAETDFDAGYSAGYEHGYSDGADGSAPFLPLPSP